MFRMSYKNVFWPINPEQYRQVSQREPVYSKDGSGNSVVTGAGPVQVTVTGSGAFSGSEAYEQFKTLLALFAQSGAGTLNHPVWGSLNAVFTKLELNQEPRPDYVSYSFEFRSTGGNTQ